MKEIYNEVGICMGSTDKQIFTQIFIVRDGFAYL